MIYKSEELIEKLSLVNWNTALRTFGNNHDGLIGLLIDWWIRLSPTEHFALTKLGRTKRTEGLGYCDAVFGAKDSAVGILEVEGNRYEHCLNKIESFFKMKEPNLMSSEFAILLVYDSVGYGIPPFDEIISKSKEVSKSCPNKSIAIISIEKEYEKIKDGIRGWSIWFWGTPKMIRWSVVREGRMFQERKFTGI